LQQQQLRVLHHNARGAVPFASSLRFPGPLEPAVLYGSSCWSTGG
jgi:hypothetical protein